MLRTIVFREGMAITRVELLELVTIAVGGAQVEQAPEDIHEPVGKLLTFISEVLHSLRRPAGDDSRGAAAAPSAPDPALKATLTEAAHEFHPQAPSATIPPDAVPQEDSAPEDMPRSSPPFRPNPFRPVHSASVPAPSAPAAPPQTPPAAAAARTSTDRAASTKHPFPSIELRGSLKSLEQRLRSALDLSPQGLRVFALSALGLCVLAFAFTWHVHRRTAALTAAASHTPARSRPAIVALPPPPIPPAEPVPDPTAAPLESAENATTAATLADENQAQPSLDRRTLSSKNGRIVAHRAPPHTKTILRNASPAYSAQRTNSASTLGPVPTANQPAGRLAYRPSPTSDYTQGSAASSEKGAAAERAAPMTAASAKGRPEASAATHLPKWQGVSSVSSGVMTSHLLLAPAPEYPKMARLTHVEGEVILQAVIARDGTVATTHALRGHHLLRSAAEHAVRRWRYRPYLIEGHPTEVATIVTVEFHLHR